MKLFAFLDPLITNWMARYGIRFLRYSIGILYIWFGALKFFPGLSPAEQLAVSTIEVLTFGTVPSGAALIALAVFEVFIGLLMLYGRQLRLTILLLLFQMAGTLSPIVLFPDIVFTRIPFGLTIEGQYIFKNFIIISSAIVIGATVRGGRLIPDPGS
ncbi:DoxX family membrane protein [Rhodohalobacter mucosus]|uniref:DoxX family membrane protein n=1 Tax=Rhodohalobacter mucosus TaxID=2079485 RepID=A0A316TVG0_9BACT|nr:DoxX family membrane protein [Rhodohalobacter mucosus]PWN07095.1 hypothetical protein DDZ15_07470 [Rhodohalobacter mucosus]